MPRLGVFQEPLIGRVWPRVVVRSRVFPSPDRTRVCPYKRIHSPCLQVGEINRRERRICPHLPLFNFSRASLDCGSGISPFSPGRRGEGQRDFSREFHKGMPGEGIEFPVAVFTRADPAGQPYFLQPFSQGRARWRDRVSRSHFHRGEPGGNAGFHETAFPWVMRMAYQIPRSRFIKVNPMSQQIFWSLVDADGGVKSPLSAGILPVFEFPKISVNIGKFPKIPADRMIGVF